MEGDLKTNIITLNNHILQQQQDNSDAHGDLSILLSSISTACKWITNVVRKAELLKVIGVTGATNIQDETQQKLDILSNEIMINMLVSSKKTCLLISEENDLAITVDGKNKGHYAVVFDPLDGSSNIDCGVSVGTIFGIYKIDRNSPLSMEEQCLGAGSTMVCGGYCMYGSCSILVLALNGVANGYTLDPNLGEFLLTHPKMKLGKKKIYSLNEGYCSTFSPAITGYLNTLKYPAKDKVGEFKPYSARYVGSMVADMHRTLLYGGIFLYPGAKLRMLYECFPMAMLVEACGGKASNGFERILDLKPKGIHDRSAIFLGTTDEVEKIEAWFKNTAA